MDWGEKILACGREEQAAGCQKKNMWDMVVVLVVEQTTNWIYVIFHVENTLKTVPCQMCGNVFKKKLESQNTCKTCIINISDIL